MRKILLVFLSTLVGLFLLLEYSFLENFLVPIGVFSLIILQDFFEVSVKMGKTLFGVFLVTILKNNVGAVFSKIRANAIYFYLLFCPVFSEFFSGSLGFF